MGTIPSLSGRRRNNAIVYKPFVRWLMVDISVVFPEPLTDEKNDNNNNRIRNIDVKREERRNLYYLGPIIPRRLPHCTFPLTIKKKR